jgi:hypothetical protein
LFLFANSFDEVGQEARRILMMDIQAGRPESARSAQDAT